MSETLSMPLANTIIICFYINKLLDCYKAIIIVVLRKANKKDYFLLRNY